MLNIRIFHTTKCSMQLIVHYEKQGGLNKEFG